MKVVFCAYDGENVMNGINAWLLSLLPFLKKEGYEITVLFITWAPNEKCTTIPLLNDYHINCIVVPGPHYTENATRWIANHVIGNNYDVFIPNSMPPALFATKWISQAGIPCISVIHSDDDEAQAIIDEFIMKTTTYKFENVVCVSSRIHDRLFHSAGKSLRLKQIACGAPVPLNKVHFPIKDNFRIIYVGRIVKQTKNIDIITRAFCQLSEKISGIELHIIGSGPDTDLVRSILQEHHHPTNIFLRGNLSPEALQNEYSKSHVIVLMSSSEGMPVSIMEAMAHGVVPVSTKIEGGMRELVIDGVTGFVIDESDKLLHTILPLMNDKNLWEKLSYSARDQIVKKFSSEIANKEWLDTIAEAAQNKKRVEVVLPKKLSLSPVNRFLSNHDERQPGLFVKLRNKYFIPALLTKKV